MGKTEFQTTIQTNTKKINKQTKTIGSPGTSGVGRLPKMPSFQQNNFEMRLANKQQIMTDRLHF